MSLRPAALLAVSLWAAAASAAAAQTAAWPAPAQQPAPSAWPQQPAPQQQTAPAQAPAPWPQQAPAQQGQPALQAPWPQAQPQQQPQEPPCMADFTKLRNDAQKKAGALQAASQRNPKPTAKEACGLFNAFSAAEIKMIKFVTAKASECGIPPEVKTNMEKSHAKTDEVRTRVCQAAEAGPAQPRAPSLSDALGAPVPDAGNIKTGRGGTFDTLTGTKLGK